MNNVKCHYCGLVNFATSGNCKQCRAPLIPSHPGGHTHANLSRYLKQPAVRFTAILLFGAITLAAVYFFLLRPEKQKAEAAIRPEIERAARIPKQEDVIHLIEPYFGTPGEAVDDGSGHLKGYGPCESIISYQFESVGISDETTYSDGKQITHAFPISLTFTKIEDYIYTTAERRKFTDVKFAVSKGQDGKWEIAMEGDLDGMGMYEADRLRAKRCN